MKLAHRSLSLLAVSSWGVFGILFSLKTSTSQASIYWGCNQSLGGSILPRERRKWERLVVHQRVNSVDTAQRKLWDTLCGQRDLDSNLGPRTRVPSAKTLNVSQPDLLEHSQRGEHLPFDPCRGFQGSQCLLRFPARACSPPNSFNSSRRTVSTRQVAAGKALYV